MSDFSTAEEQAAADAALDGHIAEYLEQKRHGAHLWIRDGDTLVCTECAVTLEDWKKGRPHVL